MRKSPRLDFEGKDVRVVFCGATIRQFVGEGMMVTKKPLRKIFSGKVKIFKLQNRRGYAAICMGNLTEGRSPVQAFYRMVKAVKRSGYALVGKVPRPR